MDEHGYTSRALSVALSVALAVGILAMNRLCPYVYSGDVESWASPSYFTNASNYVTLVPLLLIAMDAVSDPRVKSLISYISLNLIVMNIMYWLFDRSVLIPFGSSSLCAIAQHMIAVGLAAAIAHCPHLGIDHVVPSKAPPYQLVGVGCVVGAVQVVSGVVWRLTRHEARYAILDDTPWFADFAWLLLGLVYVGVGVGIRSVIHKCKPAAR